MTINLPENVKKIINRLQNAGYEAYAVGGCVRDSLLGRKPDDWDITTNARPQEVKKIFKSTVDTGIKHGTVTVLFKNDVGYKSYEVTTYRCDGLYSDGRHPDDVTFVNNLHEDLARRDFTINALAYNDDAGVVDEFSGIDDLHDKKVRAVGEPKKRFEEDALRMMRAIRFSAQLSFDIDSATYDAIKDLAPNLANVSKERIAIELIKTITSDNPSYVYLFKKAGLAKYITKDFENITEGELVKTSKKHIAFFSLLYNNNDISSNILYDLKLDMDTIGKVRKLINEKDKLSSIEDGKLVIKHLSQKTVIKLIIFNLGYELTRDFINTISFKYKCDFNDIIKMIDSYETRKVPIFLSDLAVDGDWFKSKGLEGKNIGSAMNFVLEKIWADEALNNEQNILDILKTNKLI